MHKFWLQAKKMPDIITRNWMEIIARGVPLIFIVSGLLIYFIEPLTETTFGKILFPVYMCEMYISPPWQLTDLVYGLYSSASTLFLDIPGFLIVIWNKWRWPSVVIIVAFTRDVFGLIFAAITGVPAIPYGNVWVLILIELILITSQVINLVQMSR